MKTSVKKHSALPASTRGRRPAPPGTSRKHENAPTGLTKTLPDPNRAVLTVRRFTALTLLTFLTKLALDLRPRLSTLHAPAKPIIHRYRPKSSRYKTATNTAYLRLFAPIRGHYRLSANFARIDQSTPQADRLRPLELLWRLNAWNLDLVLSTAPTSFR
jgi:hypothetical protein